MSQIGIDLGVVFVINLTSVLAVNLITIKDQVISSRKHSEDIIAFLFLVLEEVIQVSRETNGASSGTGIETIGFTAGGKDKAELADNQTEIGASNSQEGINLRGKRFTELVSFTVILHAATSDDLSGEGDTHRVGNNVDLLSLGVLEDSFSEVSQIVNIFIRVSLLGGKLLVGGTPSSDVEFTGLVTLGQEVGDGVSKTVELFTFIANSVVTVTVEENNGFSFNFVFVIGFTTVAATSNVSSVEAEASVAVVLKPLLEVRGDGLDEFSGGVNSEEGKDKS